MGLMGYDLNGIVQAITKVATAQTKLAEAEESRVKVLERIAHAMEQHWGVDPEPKERRTATAGHFR